jgi:methylmalonyl-CoA mutase
MSDVADDLVLAAEFPAATREQWQRLVAKVLGGSGSGSGAGDAPERQLATITADGIEIAPLYVAETSRLSSGYPG